MLCDTFSSCPLIVGAGPSATQVGPAGAMRYLAQHGITAESIGTGYPDLSVAEDLLATCHACEASLLVMGAYGHSRTHEAIFGGVSQHVIEHALLPVLMVPDRAGLGAQGS